MEEKNKENKGHLHPITQMIRKMNDIFSELGFSVISGPEIESDYYNFQALNIPKHHPARDLWDTIWLKLDEKGESKLMRTHTSPVQIRKMEETGAPIKAIVPGKVFRQETTDASHETQFFQLEGLMVDENITLADLKGVFKYFFSELFGVDANVRLRPGFFPFVEPGAEVDVSCFRCGGKGCSLCKKTGWIEVVGAGMVHPKVLEYGGIDAKKYQGFAFGFGVDRLAMLMSEVDDIRVFYTGDLRLVNQF